MAAFAAGGADVLVATTVIEVGIDVPNATVMLVEDAERYGLSQLHQLRGPDRPRRSTSPSACSSAPRTRAACRRWPSTRDGFRLAEIDLELRGEGEMLGVRQSGMQAFKFARLPEDVELLERARRHAREILDARPGAARARARADRGRDRPRLRPRRAGADPGLDQEVEDRPLPQTDAAAQRPAPAPPRRRCSRSGAPPSTSGCGASSRRSRRRPSRRRPCSGSARGRSPRRRACRSSPTRLIETSSERSSIGARITELAASANHANPNGSAATIVTSQMVQVAHATMVAAA